MAAKKPSKSEPCPDCQGSGTVVWATDVVACENCNGTGKVNAAPARAREVKQDG